MWTGPEPVSWRSSLALLWNLELPQWKQESLAKKWHDQTDTLKRSLWPPRAEQHSVQEVKTEVKDIAERLANGTKYLRKQKEMGARRNWGWGEEGKNSQQLSQGEDTKQYQTWRTNAPKPAVLNHELKWHKHQPNPSRYWLKATNGTWAPGVCPNLCRCTC